MPGALSGQVIGLIPESVERRFKEKLLLSPDTDCIVYTGADRSAGYKGFYITHTKQVLAHRLAYELFVGPITLGHVINHTCGNRGCCNPNHLEDVTQYENSEKGHSWDRKTHCVNGHEFDVENTWWRTNAGGYRVQRCRICTLASNRKSLAKKGVY